MNNHSFITFPEYLPTLNKSKFNNQVFPGSKYWPTPLCYLQISLLFCQIMALFRINCLSMEWIIRPLLFHVYELFLFSEFHF